MVKALRRWLEANELLAIVTGVVGALVVLSLLLVLLPYYAYAQWRAPHADKDALCHVVTLGGEEFVTTDGSRGLIRWRWPGKPNSGRSWRDHEGHRDLVCPECGGYTRRGRLHRHVQRVRSA